MNQIKFAGSESISAQPLRTPGKAECTANIKTHVPKAHCINNWAITLTKQ